MKNFGELPANAPEKKEGIPQKTIDNTFFVLADYKSTESERIVIDELVREICKHKQELSDGRLERSKMGYSIQFGDGLKDSREAIDIEAGVEDVNTTTGEYMMNFQAFNRFIPIDQNKKVDIKEMLTFKASAAAVSIYAARQAKKEEQWRKEEEEQEALEKKFLPTICTFARAHSYEEVSFNDLGADIRSSLETVFHWKLEPEDTVRFRWYEESKAWNFEWKRKDVTHDIREHADV